MSRLKRLSKIFSIAIRYRLDSFIEPEQLPGAMGKLLRLAPWHLLPTPQRCRGERLRLSLIALGPIFVKFGQMLSTRRDLLPDDIADELAKLQDQVPPFPEEQALAIIEQSLKKPVGELFAEFSSSALASASVAQVHAATLHSGEQVVVKVIRPGIEKTIRQDIALLFTLARLVEKHLGDGRRLRPVEVVEDYQHTILDELDLQKEGANTSQLRRNFENSGLLYVPEVYWDFSHRNVLVIERIDGIPVTNIDALQAQGTNMQLLAERGVEIFFTQVFRDSFFHADMHPGNVFVSKQQPESPQYIGIDCAIIGSLSESDQYYLARNLLAIFHRDYRQVAELHVECGWVPPETKVHEFESAIRSACEPIFEKPLGEISFGQLTLYLFQTARRFEMEVQPSLVLLQKTLLNIEGLGRELYPQLDLWNTAQPFLEHWLKDRYAPSGVRKRLQRHLPALLEQLPKLPEALLETLQSGRQLQEMKDVYRHQLALQEQQYASDRRRRRLTNGVIVLLLAGGLAASPEAQQALEQLPAISWPLLLLAGILWLKR